MRMGVRCCANAVLGALLLGGCVEEASSGIDELGDDDGTVGIVVGTGSGGPRSTSDDGRVSHDDTTATTTAEDTSPITTSGQATDDHADTEGIQTPVAEEDRYVVASDAVPLVVDAASGVLHNDDAGDAGPLQVTGHQAESHEGGVVDVAADGSFTYMPVEGFTGEDRFNYTATDTHGASDTARVRIIVLRSGG